MLLILILSYLVCFSAGVDRSKFKKCEDVPFCGKHKSYHPNANNYKFDGPITERKGRLQGTLVDKHGKRLSVEVSAFEEQIVRLRVREVEPASPRHEVLEVLVANEIGKFEDVNIGEDKVELSLGNNRRFMVNTKTLSFDYYIGNNVALSANKRGLLYYEQAEEKAIVLEDKNSDTAPIEIEQAKEDPVVPEEGKNLWQQTWGGQTDLNPKGPQSVGVDITFVADQVYGIPEHASDFALKPTDGSNGGYTQPYRLFNLDVFEYELDEPMALYASVPFMMGHNHNLTNAVFWFNSAETWVDVNKKQTAAGLLGGLLGYSEDSTTIDTHWRSETGIVDIFFMVGPTPKDIFRQFTYLVGRPALPPLFSIAYHQCRWNYKDEADVAEVNANFETYDIPYDVIWLDIEHTDGKRYFTWDPKYFPTPKNMLTNIAKYGRKMVTIIDPHIKRDDNYIVHKIAKDSGFYIKDGANDYDGFCWPGSSSWLDYISPTVRDWWASRFEYQNYEGSTPDLFVWNDMNEPSVFNGPEVTMRKTALHQGGWEHRDVHNIYGMFMHRATSEGLVKRNPGHNKRPFVLSRAAYAGSQRWGAIWTGDNSAQWSHLAVATPMVLSLSISGIVFSGADVGGFFGNPEPELLVRWYQAGAYQPFFRAHAHHDAKRREPWIFGQPYTNLIRSAILSRYQILPYIYTLFYQANLTGVPVMRPLWAEFPTDTSTFTTQDEFLLGGAILVKPVSSPSQASTDVYLPGDSVWYDIDTHKSYAPGTHTVDTPIEKIPVFQRGGTIVTRKTRVRRSSTQAKNDPFTYVVALDNQGQASGELYIDDGESYDYQKQGSYIYRKIDYIKTNDNTHELKSTTLSPQAKMYIRNKIERIVVLGVSKAPSSVKAQDNTHEQQRSLHFEYKDNVLVIKKPDVIVSAPWTIEIAF